MTWAWARLVAVLMVPPTVSEETKQQSDDLPTARATSVYRLSAIGDELW